MSRLLNTKRLIALLATFLLAAVATPAMAQQQPGGGGAGGGGAGGPGGGRIDPTQFRQMMNDRMKELMGANDEEWKALQPRIEKLQQLQRDASNFGGMGLLMDFGGGGGGGRGGRGFGGPGGAGGDRQPSVSQQKTTELVEVVKNKESSPEQLKEKLAAAKAARAQAKAELAKAQEELRELLTVRQEAVLTAIGTLD